MRVAIDITPISKESGHKVRGSGFYVQNLVNQLKKSNQNTYLFYSKKTGVPLDADIVHIPYFDPFFITLPLRKTKKTVVTVHDLTPFVFPRHFPAGIKGMLKWKIQNKLLKKSDAIITDSESSKKDIVKITGYPDKKIFVIYLAAASHFKKIKLSEDQEKKILEKYSLPQKFVLYVGDVTWNKNIPGLIEAMKQIDIPLVMVGKALANKTYDVSNPWNRDLNIVQKETQDNKQFIKLGFIPDDDLVALYNLTTVFVMPSRYEGFGLPVVEAMSCGTPVVSTTGGSLSEIIGNAAIQIDSENIQNIAKKVKEVFEDKKLQIKLSEKSLEQARKFSWEKTAQETIEVYKKIF